LDRRIDLETGTADRPGSAPTRRGRDRVETLAIMALCLLTGVQVVVVVLICIDAVRAAFG